MIFGRMKFIILFIATVVIFAGCASIAPRNILPEEYVEVAEIPGVPDARFFADEMETFWEDKISEFGAERVEEDFSGILNRKHDYLAISGGGSNGAYGAGVLVGWTASGNRPEFTMVTGVSTGALTAPFAFLGSAYDEELKKAFTSFSTKDLAKRQSVFYMLNGDSIISTSKMLEYIQELFDETMLEAIAVEHKRGRRLFIGTFNMDSGRPVVWNIGRIAMSDRSDALDLFHHVLLASASIPGAFPPVRFTVEAHGGLYDELHADGGIAAQVFFFPPAIDWSKFEGLFNPDGRSDVFIIRNSFLNPKWEPVRQRMFPLIGRSIDSLVRTQGIGDLNTIFLLCKREDIDFNLTYIPATFENESGELFDREYMESLFDEGFKVGSSTGFWKKTPPGFESLGLRDFSN